MNAVRSPGAMNPPDPNGRHGPTPPAFTSDPSSIPWAEIFSRHETVLSSHLDMLGTVKGHVAPDGEAFRTVSTMVNRTVQAMNQFKVVRKHMLNKKSPENTFDPSKMKREATPAQTTDPETKHRRKRSRTDKENERATNHLGGNAKLPGDAEDDTRASKRKRDIHSHPSGDPEHPQDQSPMLQETEDISEEVQRRLRIKEERRRKKDHGKAEKRKRESLMSNESTSPRTARPKKKRVRSEGG